MQMDRVKGSAAPAEPSQEQVDHSGGNSPRRTRVRARCRGLESGDRPLRRSLTHTPPTAAQSKASTRAATSPKARPDRLGLRLHKPNGRPTNAPTLLLHQPFSSSSGSGWRPRPPTRSTGPANERSSQPGCDAGLACLTTDCPFAEPAICCWSPVLHVYTGGLGAQAKQGGTSEESVPRYGRHAEIGPFLV